MQSIVTHKNYLNLEVRFGNLLTGSLCMFPSSSNIELCFSALHNIEKKGTVWLFRHSQLQYSNFKERNYANLCPALTNSILFSTHISVLHQPLWLASCRTKRVYSGQNLIYREEQLQSFVLPIIMCLATMDRTNLTASRNS